MGSGLGKLARALLNVGGKVGRGVARTVLPVARRQVQRSWSSVNSVLGRLERLHRQSVQRKYQPGASLDALADRVLGPELKNAIRRETEMFYNHEIGDTIDRSNIFRKAAIGAYNESEGMVKSAIERANFHFLADPIDRIIKWPLAKSPAHTEALTEFATYRGGSLDHVFAHEFGHMATLGRGKILGAPVERSIWTHNIRTLKEEVAASVSAKHLINISRDVPMTVLEEQALLKVYGTYHEGLYVESPIIKKIRSTMSKQSTKLENLLDTMEGKLGSLDSGPHIAAPKNRATIHRDGISTHDQASQMHKWT